MNSSARLRLLRQPPSRAASLPGREARWDPECARAGRAWKEAGTRSANTAGPHTRLSLNIWFRHPRVYLNSCEVETGSSCSQCANVRSWLLRATKVGHMRDAERDIVLVCEICGGRTVLGGPLAVWRSESTTFSCECGERLTLADRADPGGSNRV